MVARLARRTIAKGRERGTAPAPSRFFTRPLGAALVALLAGANTWWVFEGARNYGFAQDDWTALARVKGLAAAAPPLWRWLSQNLDWRFFAGPLAGDTRYAHTMVVLVFALAAALLGVLLARRTGAAAALVAVAWYTSHYAHFHSAYWLSAHGDLLAMALALLVALACGAKGARRWLAVPLFALALGAKESAVALPFALALMSWRGPWRQHAGALMREPLAWTLAGMALAWLLALRLQSGASALGGEAYALSPNAIGPNLLTYCSWAANAWWHSVTDISDAVSPKQFGWGAALLAAGIATAFVPATRSRGAAGAFAAFLVLLAPVLPLAAHTYRYYLTLPLAALALWLAIITCALVSAWPRRWPRPIAWALAGAAAGSMALNGHALVHRIEQLPWRTEGSRAEAIMDRALIAQRTLEDLRASYLPAGTVLHLWSPQSRALATQQGGAADHESYDEHNVRAALAEGLAVCVTLPAVREVRFEDTFAPANASERWAVYRTDGRLRVLRADTLAALLAAGPPGGR